MDFNATLVGQAISVWIVIATVLTFILAKRKTQTPLRKYGRYNLHVLGGYYPYK